MRRWGLAMGLACACAPAAPRPADSPLPSVVATPLGAVRVERVPGLRDSAAAYGQWDWERRVIQIDAALPAPAAWLVFYHEHCHVAFTASGLAYLVTEAEQDAVCDAVATARFRERFG